MLRSFNRFNQPMIPPFVEDIIRNRVSKRAAFLSGQMSLQLEISKSQRLIEIENRYRTDQIKKVERTRRP
jgi:hypothetical protein